MLANVGPMIPRLVLWDVDHTLIETRGFGAELYRRAFEEVTGRRMEHRVEVTGRTELAIWADTLRLHAIEPTTELERDYAIALARQYELHADELSRRGRTLPGAGAALDALAARGPRPVRPYRQPACRRDHPAPDLR